jgi:hypothetical protein
LALLTHEGLDALFALGAGDDELAVEAHALAVVSSPPRSSTRRPNSPSTPTSLPHREAPSWGQVVQRRGVSLMEESAGMATSAEFRVEGGAGEGRAPPELSDRR